MPLKLSPLSPDRYRFFPTPSSRRQAIGALISLTLASACHVKERTNSPKGDSKLDLSKYSHYVRYGDDVRNFNSAPSQSKDQDETKNACDNSEGKEVAKKGILKTPEASRKRLNQIKAYVDRFLAKHPDFKFPKVNVYIPAHDPSDEGYLSPSVIHQAVTHYCQDVPQNASMEKVTQVMAEGEPLKVEDITSTRRYTAYVLHLNCDLVSNNYDVVCENGKEKRKRRSVNGLSIQKTKAHPAYVIVKALPEDEGPEKVTERLYSITTHELGHKEDDEKFGLTEKAQKVEYDASEVLKGELFDLSGKQNGDTVSANELSETTGDSLQILIGGHYSWEELRNAHKKTGTLYQGKVDILNGIFFEVPGNPDELGEAVANAIDAGFLTEDDRKYIAQFNYILAQEGLSEIKEISEV